MTVHLDNLGVTIHEGDCLDVMRTLPDASIDAVVTDPPYALEFMGRGWDRFTPGEFQHWCEQWAAECLRLLKPGGHLLAFGGTRTWHRLAAGIEDAGFDIRDSIAWMYGNGFPKSLDVARAIERLRTTEADPEARAEEYRFTAWMRSTGVTPQQLNDVTGSAMGGHYTTAGTQPAIPTAAMLDAMRPILPPIPDWVEQIVTDRETAKAEARARGLGKGFLDSLTLNRGRTPDDVEHVDATAWAGWGTALKPAFEPIVVARKPLAGTVAANVATHGTGALNIDACRTGDGPSPSAEMRAAGKVPAPLLRDETSKQAAGRGAMVDRSTPEAWLKPRAGEQLGRWPANVVLDTSQAAELDRQAPDTGAAGRASGPTRTGPQAAGTSFGTGNGTDAAAEFYGDSGGASRFFKIVDDAPRFRYVPKAPQHERPKVPRDGAGEARVLGAGLERVRTCNVCGSSRNLPGSDGPACGHDDFRYADLPARPDQVAHPTVKPVDLMRWLVRLVTPKGGTVLEPFAGSGTTVEAAVLEGFGCVAIEREAEYLPLIMQRISKPHAVGLFDFDDEDTWGIA